ncbi:single-stranded DNA-binding protein ['Santalum album' aster yellows phytoplasma]|uniref:Single-stranded DNA-binding protein n=1 Tax='Santalum album' aster yellows phytoplasma TaxID=2831467 RepID=A0ABS5LL20_9MOLU|nr:single-stranded DNA-binding protein ['Santalum album' aster yellows phytoplasma]MBS2993805.1 single-stranded DNA-binding protein ['Santalum album' aster yellows phytoplasma]
MLNKVQLIGRLTHDLEKQYINSNNEQILKIDFQLVVNLKDITQFIPCVAFRKLAENMSKYLHKGSKIYGEGSLSIQKYKNHEGQTRTMTKVILQNVIFLDNKPQENLPFLKQ